MRPPGTAFALLVLLTLPAQAAPAASSATSAGAADDYAAGMSEVAKGDLATALDRLEAAVTAAPDELRYGADYRQVAIAAAAYDRSLDLFAGLAEAHPDSYAVHLNWGYAYVDKIPAAGAITQVILADTALKHFTEALAIEPSWLAYYTRGNSYVYWPAIFHRTPLAIADLEKAVELSQARGDEAPSYHAHAYKALGDAYWRLDDLDQARTWWQRGHERFPTDADLGKRLTLSGAELDAYLKGVYEIGQRVDTSLSELWEER